MMNKILNNKWFCWTLLFLWLAVCCFYIMNNANWTLCNSLDDNQLFQKTGLGTFAHGGAYDGRFYPLAFADYSIILLPIFPHGVPVLAHFAFNCITLIITVIAMFALLKRISSYRDALFGTALLGCAAGFMQIQMYCIYSERLEFLIITLFLLRYHNLRKSDSSFGYVSIFLMLVLAKFISDGTLVDSFLEKHPSNSLLKIERSFNPYYLQSLIHSLYTVFLPVKNSISKNGETIFDVVRNAASSETISKKELSHLVGSTSSYMKDITLIIIDIQRGVTDKIDYPPLLNFYKEHKEPQYYLYSEYDITGLIDKYPKSEDFEREVNKLLPRIAYQTYHEINIAKFLYKEWRETYYSQVKELFANAVIIADKLYETMKDEVLPDNPEDSRRYAYKNTMQYILDIKEIAKIGVDKILTSADCYIDSQEEIKASLYKSFMETRKAHLKKLEK